MDYPHPHLLHMGNDIGAGHLVQNIQVLLVLEFLNETSGKNFVFLRVTGVAGHF